MCAPAFRGPPCGARVCLSQLGAFTGRSSALRVPTARCRLVASPFPACPLQSRSDRCTRVKSMLRSHSKAQRRTQSHLRHQSKIRQRIETLRALLDSDEEVEMEKVIRNPTLALHLLLVQADVACATLLHGCEGMD